YDIVEHLYNPMTHLVFFFQAEDGIRDRNVTGVQTCALPIFSSTVSTEDPILQFTLVRQDAERHVLVLRISHAQYDALSLPLLFKIGRASCRERVYISVYAVPE